MVRAAGVEPTSCGFGGRYSIQLSYARSAQNTIEHYDLPPAESASPGAVATQPSKNTLNTIPVIMQQLPGPASKSARKSMLGWVEGLRKVIGMFNTVLWIYIALLVVGGLMGFIKGKSKISLISSVLFA